MDITSVPFHYQGRQVRTVLVDGQAWFVGIDVAAALELGNHRDALGRLDEDGVGTADVTDSLGRTQSTRIISEAGLYQLIFQSRVPAADTFRRWVTHDVLPTIRRTGTYSTPETPQQVMARGLVAAQQVIEQAQQQVEALTPRAEAWDELADAAGDYSVADAANVLCRAGITTGRQRLFQTMREVGWLYEQGGRLRPRQTAVERGYVRSRVQSHRHPRTGDLVVDPPQVRVTLRGLERLRICLGGPFVPELRHVMESQPVGTGTMAYRPA